VGAVTAVDDRLDAFWRRVCGDVPVMAVRDRRHLQWRFLRRPDAAYTILLAERGPEIAGYLVLRRAVRDGVPWGYLVDFLVEGGQPATWSMLVRRALALFREDGVALAGCMVNRPEYRRPLARLGFLPWRWGPQGYFHPRVDVPDPAVRAARDLRQWLVTLGDGDVEMAF
jgi:hypothetical protein